MIELKNKTVLITGATRGIGEATANLFEENGANLILTGTNKEQINQLNKSYFNTKRNYFQLDLKSKKSINVFLKQLEVFEKIDILINNAGVNILDDFTNVKTNDIDTMLSVNLVGPFLLSQYCSKKMKAQKYGRIINICSIWSKITRSKRSIYTATKNALHGMTQTMAVELGADNILVNSISPGFTMTELTSKTNSKKELIDLSKKIPLKRLAQPKEISKLILFLSSEENTYLTGQNIVIDGGYTIV